MAVAGPWRAASTSGEGFKGAPATPGGIIIMAEREGFEPSVEVSPHTRLAGEHLRPLGHLSGPARTIFWFLFPADVILITYVMIKYRWQFTLSRY
jgi:hypothetical protein